MNMTATPFETINAIYQALVGVGLHLLQKLFVPLYFDLYANPVASVISFVSLGLIPHSWLMPAIHALTGSIAFAVGAPLYMEALYQYTKYFYDLGIMKRYQNSLPDDRDYVTNFLAALSITLPFGFWRAFNHERISAKTIFSLDPVTIVVFHYVVFFSMDAWYFFGHRYMHKNKFFWNWIHKHHHEKKNINTFSTGYAAFVENLILVSPVIVFSALAMDNCFDQFNQTAFDMAWFSQFKVFILGHSGMRMHPLMYFPWIFSGFQQVFGSFSNIPEDHEMHHLYVMSNFALNFRFLDRWFGSYKPIEYVMDRRKTAEATKVADASESRAQGTLSDKTE
ncbi:hypothetical protein HK102_006296 [Quaeritorhiza haematococci]|nr:hypothetical protein HK102_006296 [Quaeritorhiza haematococci]